MIAIKRLALLSLLVASTEVFAAPSSSNLASFGHAFSTVWGKPYPSSAWFFPVGWHFRGDSTGNNTNLLFAANLHGIIGGTFINSFNRRIYFAGVPREAYTKNRLSIGYLLAIMHGYRGEGLKDLGPFISHDPGPLLAIAASWSITPHMSVSALTYGAGCLVGVSYIF